MKAFLSAFIALISVLTSFVSNADFRAEFKNKGDITGYAQTVTAEKELKDFELDDDGDFTVLQFSDTHFTSFLNFSDLQLLNKMEQQIESLDPDLVVVTGDMVNDGDRGTFNKAYVLRTVAEMFEENDQYWAYIPGNNDGINYGTSADVTAYLCQYEHCLVSDVPEISGGAQYSIDLTSDGELVHSFIFLDTMDYDDEDPDHNYGYVHEDQVNWCRDELNAKKTENPDVKVSVFLHENTPNFRKAAKHGDSYETAYPTVIECAEKYDIPKNQPLDDVIDASGVVGLLTMGHSHPAYSCCSFWNNKYYHVAPQTAVASVLITVHTAESDVRQMYDFAPCYL